MKVWGYIGVVGLLIGMAIHANAQGLQGGTGSRTYTVARGRIIPLGQHYTSSNCGFTGVPQVTILQSPTLGDRKPSHGADDSREHALGRFGQTPTGFSYGVRRQAHDRA
jgi:hypothetical protein